MSIDTTGVMEKVTEAVRALYRKGDIIEVRGLRPPDMPQLGRYGYNKKLIEVLEMLNKDGFDCYFCLNPTTLEPTPTQPYQKGTKKGDVKYRRWFLLDGDPVRALIPGETDKRYKIASDTEWQAACDVMQRVMEHLESMGWNGIVKASSGNGCHLLVPCDLPNDENAERVIKTVQLFISAKFNTPEVIIECFCDSDRITRAYGTMNLKGVESDGRKHRQSEILSVGEVPEKLRKMPCEIMGDIVHDNPLPEVKGSVKKKKETGEGPWDEDALYKVLVCWKKAHEDDFDFDKTPRYDGWQVYCPGNHDGGWPGEDREHGEKYRSVNDSSIVYLKDGWPCFVCKHNACNEVHATGKKKFAHLMKYYDPELKLMNYLSIPEEIRPPFDYDNPAFPVEDVEMSEAEKVALELAKLDEVDSVSVESALSKAETPENEVIDKCGRVIGKGLTRVGNQARLRAIRACSITPEKLVWLWPQRIPAGKITWLVGPPDNGKSMTLLDVIARVTTGRDWPDGEKNTMGPKHVILAASEDDLADTLIPRLIAAGTDMIRVDILPSKAIREYDADLKTDDDEMKYTNRMFQLSEDITLLIAALTDNPEIAVVGLDPISSYFGDVNSNIDKEIRPVMDRLSDACAATGVSLLGVSHENKRSDASAAQKMLGASSVIGAGRTAWAFAKDDENEGEYFMSRIKNNVSKKHGGMKYRIEGVQIGNGIEAPKIVWLAEHEQDADAILATKREKAKNGSTDTKNIMANLLVKTHLEASGRCYAADVYTAGEKEGLNTKILYRAAKGLGVLMTKEGLRSVWTDLNHELNKKAVEARERCMRADVPDEAM